MEGQIGYENPLGLELMLLNYGGNVDDISFGAGDDPNHHFISSDERSENLANALPLPHWSECQRAPQNYHEFLTENSSPLDKAPPHVLESIPPSVSDWQLFQTQSLHNNPGIDYGAKLAHSSPDLDAWKLNPYPFMFNSDLHEASLNVGYLKPYNEGDLVSKLKISQHESQVRGNTSWTQGPSEAIGNLSQGRPRAKVAASVVLPKSCDSASKQRAILSDRVSRASFQSTRRASGSILDPNMPQFMRRRERIAKELKALQELLPHSAEGSHSALMDQIVDYVKYLHLQIKELSQSRLGNELCPNPSIFLQGYNHYIVQGETMNEPLEETMTKLLKVNSSVATKFLESKGLVVLPMALVDSLQQALQNLST